MGFDTRRGLGAVMLLLVLGITSAQGNWEIISARDLLTGQEQARASLRETQQGQFQLRDGILSFECRGDEVVVTLEHDHFVLAGNYTLQYRVGDSAVKSTVWVAKSGDEVRGGMFYLGAMHTLDFFEDLITRGGELVIRYEDQTYLFHHAGAIDAVAAIPCVAATLR